jgi:hypothetical protein
MPFLFKSYRLTRSTQEVLARLRFKLVLSESSLLFFGPGIGHPPRGLSHPSFLHSFGVVILSVPCCLSFHSLSRSSGLIALLLVEVSR